MPYKSMPNCFALLDDYQASPAEPRSRLYTGYRQALSCADAAAFPLMLEQMQQALQQGLHAVALWTYELGAALHDIPAGSHAGAAGLPLAQVLLFDECRHLSREQVDIWLEQQAAQENRKADINPQHAGVCDVSASVDEQEFSAAIARIRDYIAAGDTYQVNYTYRLHFSAFGSATALYRRLRRRQPVPYGAFIQCADGRSVLSFSPELFVSHRQGLLKAKPMKGTARAAADDEADAVAINAQRSLALSIDEKNRAENLMIVDLLRNDLGRIAESGSVQVPHLFDVRRYGQVLQMTSTIHARLRPQTTLPDAIAALYPCGSITGAPKRRTMQIIDELESQPRGLYTGAIGWFDAPRQTPSGTPAIGDFCLSVPIRTLVLEAPEDQRPGSLRRGVLGVGAGIVYDSDAASEYAECQLKASFLTGLAQDFSLFETMYATAQGCRHLELHLQRLRTSAASFGFVFEEHKIRQALDQTCAGLPTPTPTTTEDGQAYRLKLSLHQDGRIALQHAALTPLPADVNVFLAPQTMNSADLFLRHKSSVRAIYDQAWRAAENLGGFDMLFFNERDELTEGGRSNVFVKLDGVWLTPPLSAGVLPGVMRSVLLNAPEWNAQEAVVSRRQLISAEEIVVCNALRGAVRVVLAELTG
ncbi:bifunctional anthranilate synthase component I family protein/class IV aminotransferase [Herbaspirillum lusitanum]|uniref:Bifunctional anthranilate synthase component I family protein/class IV aminotransferase n=1 Tax=Herbaspirillum lusitanum TaxID=213312 RepID=A0ABW9A561_9BURK